MASTVTKFFLNNCTTYSSGDDALVFRSHLFPCIIFSSLLHCTVRLVTCLSANGWFVWKKEEIDKPIHHSAFFCLFAEHQGTQNWHSWCFLIYDIAYIFLVLNTFMVWFLFLNIIWGVIMCTECLQQLRHFFPSTSCGTFCRIIKAKPIQ